MKEEKTPLAFEGEPDLDQKGRFRSGKTASAICQSRQRDQRRLTLRIFLQKTKKERDKESQDVVLNKMR